MVSDLTTDETVEQDTVAEPDGEIFAVFGLYQDRHVPKMIHATDAAHASAQYHRANPGWNGTVYVIKRLSEILEMEPVDG